MKKSSISAPLFLLSMLCFSQEVEGLSDLNVQKIAFGSCSKESYVDKQLWQEVVDADPDLWIWLGDNIYGDSEDVSVLKAKYDKQKEHPDYQKLLTQMEVIGTWDDHDYGENDGGKEYPKKEESRDLLFDFLDVAEDHAAWSRKGAYQSYTYQFENKQLKIILLDARYFRDPLKKNDAGNNVPDYEGEILGDQQWDWLEDQLKDEADLILIGSGIQVLAKDHRFEKWANFPNQRNKLINMVMEHAKGPTVFLSGDRHISELSKLEMPTGNLPIYDITSSSLTHGWSQRNPEYNELRVCEIIYDENFAVLEIDWSGTRPQLTLKYVGREGKELSTYEWGY